jgi:hypothetical protein
MINHLKIDLRSVACSKFAINLKKLQVFSSSLYYSQEVFFTILLSSKHLFPRGRSTARTERRWIMAGKGLAGNCFFAIGREARGLQEQKVLAVALSNCLKVIGHEPLRSFFRAQNLSRRLRSFKWADWISFD